MMAYDPEKHHRRSIRLPEYDYSQPGAYFVTICTQNRLCLFGDVVNAEMVLNDAGRMVEAEWRALPERFLQVESDEFIVMPNHLHGIIIITDSGTFTDVGAPLVGAPGAETGAGTGQRAGTRPVPLQVRRWGILRGHSNLSPPMNTSMVSNNVGGRDSPANCGNAIITNILSAMTMN